jgi:hypothetical protein
MLLKTWEKHEPMSTKGEKRGFSGGMAHWMVCKVLKRKGYYVDSTSAYLAAFSLWFELAVVFRIEIKMPNASRTMKLLVPSHLLGQGCRHCLLTWFYDRQVGELPRSADGPRLISSLVHSCRPNSWLRHMGSLANFAKSFANFAVKIFNRKGRQEIPQSSPRNSIVLQHLVFL